MIFSFYSNSRKVDSISRMSSSCACIDLRIISKIKNVPVKITSTNHQQSCPKFVQKWKSLALLQCRLRCGSCVCREITYCIVHARWLDHVCDWVNHELCTVKLFGILYCNYFIKLFICCSCSYSYTAFHKHCADNNFPALTEFHLQNWHAKLFEIT